MSSDAIGSFDIDHSIDGCMVEARAVVVAVENAWAWVEAEPNHACNSCSAAKGCGTKMLATFTGKRKPEEACLLCLPNTFGAKVGEAVIIGLEGRSLLKAGAWAYLMPALTMVLGAIVGSVHGDLAVVLGAIGGLLAGIGLLSYQFGASDKDILQQDDIAEITFIRRDQNTPAARLSTS